MAGPERVPLATSVLSVPSGPACHSRRAAAGMPGSPGSPGPLRSRPHRLDIRPVQVFCPVCPGPPPPPCRVPYSPELPSPRSLPDAARFIAHVATGFPAPTSLRAPRACPTAQPEGRGPREGSRTGLEPVILFRRRWTVPSRAPRQRQLTDCASRQRTSASPSTSSRCLSSGHPRAAKGTAAAHPAPLREPSAPPEAGAPTTPLGPESVSRRAPVRRLPKGPARSAWTGRGPPSAQRGPNLGGAGATARRRPKGASDPPRRCGAEGGRRGGGGGALAPRRRRAPPRSRCAAARRRIRQTRRGGGGPEGLASCGPCSCGRCPRATGASRGR